MPKRFKKKEWVTCNRMKFDSMHRTFNRQVDLISDGNVVSRVQHSSIIRPYSDTNGGACKPGACRRFDINGMTGMRYGIPVVIREYLDSHPEEKCWLYRFKFPNGDTVGWILTDYQHSKSIEKCVCSPTFVGCPSAKRCSIIDEAEKYVVKGNWDTGD